MAVLRMYAFANAVHWTAVPWYLLHFAFLRALVLDSGGDITTF
jgi:hypothetical protein